MVAERQTFPPARELDWSAQGDLLNAKLEVPIAFVRNFMPCDLCEDRLPFPDIRFIC